MSVTFNLRTAAGVDYTISSICYGILRNFPFTCSSFNSNTHSNSPEVGPDNVNSRDFSHIEYVLPSDVLRKCREDDVDIYDHLKKMYEDLPMFGGIVRVMPQKGVIRIPLNNQPADKVMMALFFARTLCRSFQLRSHTIRDAINLGYGYRESMIGSMFGTLNTGMKHMNYLGESSLFNPGTFGLTSAFAYMTQDKCYKPWVQEDFYDSGPSFKGGYLRDYDLEELGVPFNMLASPKVEDEDDEGYNEYWDGPRTDCRKMIDCFSIPDDRRPLCASQKYIEDEGFTTLTEYRTLLECTLSNYVTVLNTLRSYRGG
jgi:hypothetical protein